MTGGHSRARFLALPLLFFLLFFFSLRVGFEEPPWADAAENSPPKKSNEPANASTGGPLSLALPLAAAERPACLECSRLKCCCDAPPSPFDEEPFLGRLGAGAVSSASRTLSCLASVEGKVLRAKRKRRLWRQVSSYTISHTHTVSAHAKAASCRTWGAWGSEAGSGSPRFAMKRRQRCS